MPQHGPVKSKNRKAAMHRLLGASTVAPTQAGGSNQPFVNRPRHDDIHALPAEARRLELSTSRRLGSPQQASLGQSRLQRPRRQFQSVGPYQCARFDEDARKIGFVGEWLGEDRVAGGQRRCRPGAIAAVAERQVDSGVGPGGYGGQLNLRYRLRGSSSRRPPRPRSIAHPREQPGDRDVFVEFVPV